MPARHQWPGRRGTAGSSPMPTPATWPDPGPGHHHRHHPLRHRGGAGLGPAAPPADPPLRVDRPRRAAAARITQGQVARATCRCAPRRPAPGRPSLHRSEATATPVIAPESARPPRRALRRNASAIKTKLSGVAIPPSAPYIVRAAISEAAASGCEKRVAPSAAQPGSGWASADTVTAR
jgi:hypothetical protein